MANPALIPDLEPNAVRNIALVALHGRVRPGNILGTLAPGVRGQWSVLVTDRPSCVANVATMCAKVPAYIRKAGAAAIKPELRVVIVEVANEAEIGRARRALKAVGYTGRLCFVASKQLLSQFRPGVRSQVTFVGKTPTATIVRLIA